MFTCCRPASGHWGASTIREMPMGLELTPRLELVDQLWADLTRALPAAELGRIRGGLDVWAGARAADLAPGQRTMFDLYMPGLPSAPWNDAGDFACTRLLEEAYFELRAELDEALADGLPMQPFGRAPDGRPLVPGPVDPGWTEIKLHWMNRPVEANCALLPRAAAVMEAVFAESRVLSLFSYLALAPGARSGEHSDPINALVSCHLGLHVPPDCGLRVAGESRSWLEGRCIAFDNSYPHEAWNDHATQTRIVLAVHGPHPDLSIVEREALAWLAQRLLGADPP
jgi:aspartate beta-hydroxylase